jgi:ABC-type transport system involved in cytochrome c biogenesis ATPase subunit
MSPHQEPVPNPDAFREDVETRSVLRVQDLRFGWPGGTLFDGLNIDIRAGIHLVSGDEGCGKTTLLRLLAGECAAQSGTFSLLGRQTGPLSEAYRGQVFWIDPKTDVHNTGTAMDFLATVRHHHPAFDDDALADMIEGFALQPHLAKPLYMLSAGSKRKVWLSAAFAACTPLTLIDQPFAALDGPSIRFLTALLQEAAQLSQRAWVLADYEAPPSIPLAGTIRC